MEARQKFAFGLMNGGAILMLLGGVGDLFIALRGVPPRLWESIIGPSTPAVLRLSLALLAALGSSLIASAVAILFIVNGPLKQGAPWSKLFILLIALFSDGANSIAIGSLHLAYFCIPLSFVILILAGVFLTQEPRR